LLHFRNLKHQAIRVRGEFQNSNNEAGFILITYVKTSGRVVFSSTGSQSRDLNVPLFATPSGIFALDVIMAANENLPLPEFPTLSDAGVDTVAAAAVQEVNCPTIKWADYTACSAEELAKKWLDLYAFQLTYFYGFPHIQARYSCENSSGAKGRSCAMVYAGCSLLETFNRKQPTSREHGFFPEKPLAASHIE